jgi:ATP-dependent RNA helicase RhlB
MELSYEHMNAPEKFVVTPEQMTVEKIEQTIYHVGKEEKMGLLLGMIRHEGEGRYLIFCNMKVTVERVADTLTANGHPAAAIIGDLPQKKRLKVIEHFKDGTVPILVATDVASRGLHIDNVTHVINYDIPQDPEDYVHRIGRTGRAGSTGKAVSFGCEDYVLTLPEIEAYIKESIPTAPVTDELVVTEFKRPPRRPRPDKKLYPDRQQRPDRRRTDKKHSSPAASSDGPKPRSRRRTGKKPGAPPAQA